MLKKLLFLPLLLIPIFVSAQRTVSFQDKLGHIAIRGQVNGRKGTFFLDTGTPYAFLINNNYVPMTGNRLVQEDTVGLLSKYVVYESDECKVSFGGMSFGGGTSVKNADLGMMQSFCSDFLGFIGYGFLKDYRFVLDFGKSLMILSPAGVRVPSAVVGHKSLIHVKFRTSEMEPNVPVCDGKVGSVPFTVSFDTGNHGEISVTEILPQLKIQGDRLCSMEGISICGSLPVYLYDLELIPGDSNRLTVGTNFLRYFVSVWDFSTHTLDIYQ